MHCTRLVSIAASRDTWCAYPGQTFSDICMPTLGPVNADLSHHSRMLRRGIPPCTVRIHRAMYFLLSMPTVGSRWHSAHGLEYTPRLASNFIQRVTLLPTFSYTLSHNCIVRHPVFVFDQTCREESDACDHSKYKTRPLQSPENFNSWSF